MISRQVKLFILIHICISLAGLAIHLTLHPVDKSIYYWWASPVNAFSLFVITFLYVRPSTVAWGFMLNAFTVLIGTLTMSYYSLLTLERPLTLYLVLTKSPLAGIIVLWIKVPVAYYILVMMKTGKKSDPEPGGAK